MGRFFVLKLPGFFARRGAIVQAAPIPGPPRRNPMLRGSMRLSPRPGLLPFPQTKAVRPRDPGGEG